MNLIKYSLWFFLQLHVNETVISIGIRLLDLIANQSSFGQNNF